MSSEQTLILIKPDGVKRGLVGEVIATAGLVALIGVLSNRDKGRFIPVAVAAWIGSAYLFTASTSFANPAVTVGRIFSNTFATVLILG